MGLAPGPPCQRSSKKSQSVRRLPNVFQAGQKRGGRRRADRSVKRPPIVQRQCQEPQPSHVRSLATDDQRENSDRPTVFLDNQHLKLLVLTFAEVPPEDFEPFERLKERRPLGFFEQIAPMPSAKAAARRFG